MLKTKSLNLIIDKHGYKQKPQGSEFANISKRFNNDESEKTKLELDNLYLFQLLLEQGHSFLQGQYIDPKKGRKKDNMTNISTLVIDVDNDNVSEPYKPEDVTKAIAEVFNNAVPIIVYETFSSTALSIRFRLIYVLDDEISGADYELLYNYLVDKLNESYPNMIDGACKDPSRIFLGTNKRVEPLLDYYHEIDTSIIEEIKHEHELKLEELKAQREANRKLRQAQGYTNDAVEQLKAIPIYSDYIERFNLNSVNAKSAPERSADGQLAIACPIHQGGDNNFYIKNNNGVYLWQCFSQCGGDGGTIIDLYMRLHHIADNDAGFSEAVIELCKLFNIGTSTSNNNTIKAVDLDPNKDELKYIDFYTLNSRNKPKVDPAKLAIYMTQRFDLIIYKRHFRIKKDDSNFYSQLNDVKPLIQAQIDRKELIKSKDVEEVEKILSNDADLIKDDEDLADDNYICFKNGVLDLEAKELLDFDDPKVKDLIFLSQVNYNYNAKIIEELNNNTYTGYKRYGSTEEYLNTLNFFNSATDENKQDIKFLMQLIGVTISNKRQFKNLFFIYGAKDTGKSVYMSILEHLLTNPDNTKDYSSIGLRVLTDETSKEFNAIIGKKANICAETPKLNITNDTLLKQLSGGDTVTAHVKNQQPISFVNKAVMIFSGNALPKFFAPDQNAISERVVSYEFKKRTAKEDQIKGLADKLDYELIIAVAVEELYKFIDNNQFFVEPAEAETHREEQRREVDAVYSFFQDCIEITNNPDDRISTNELYQCYKDYYVDEREQDLDAYNKYSNVKPGQNEFISQFKDLLKNKQDDAKDFYIRSTSYNGHTANIFKNIQIVNK